MNGVLLVLIIVVIAAIGLAVYGSSKASGRRSAASLADAKADARRVIERLGGQVLNLTGTDDASKQAMADASERYTAASSQIDQATTARQAALAKESAHGGPVLRARRAYRDGHGSRARNWSRSPGSGRRAPSPRTGESTSRAARSRRRPTRRSAPRTTTPAAEWPGRPVPGGLVLGAVVEAGAGGRRVGPWLGAAVRRDVLRHARS